MFLISDEVEKKSKPYDVVASELDIGTGEQISTRSNGTRKKKVILLRFILAGILIVFVFCALIVWGNNMRNKETSITKTNDEVYLLATQTIHEVQTIMERVSQGNAVISIKNKKDATMYVNGMQDLLKKRVQTRVKTISQLVQDKVQDIENQLAIFERVISSAIEGNLDFTKINIDKIKSTLDTSVTGAITISMLNDAIDAVEKNISSFTHDFGEMYTYYGRYIDNILHHKTENITNRIRMNLVADRKLFRDVAAPRVATCYKIARQNYDISGNLERVFDALNKLRKATDTVNMISSVSGEDPPIVEAKNSLDVALYDTEQAFYSMMNTDHNFLGTLLKEQAFESHLEIKDFILQSYEVAIRSLVPAIKKISRNFQVVKEDHWQKITNFLTPLLADVRKLIESKVHLLPTGGSTQNRVKNFDFVSVYTLVEDKFKNVLAVVNPLFDTKQSQMFEGLSMSLDFTIAEQLPLISAWSLKNYLPADACPMSIDFQTYLKATMDRYLSQSINLQIVPATLEQTLELDGEFDPANVGTTTKSAEDDALLN